MKYLVCFISAVFAATIVSVSARSALVTNPPDIKSPEGNIIILDAPVSKDLDNVPKASIEGDKLIVKGKNFANATELVGILEEAQKSKDFEKSQPEGPTVEPFTLKVPIARRFSSLKELFEILNEGPDIKPKKSKTDGVLDLKGADVDSSEYTIFFSS